MANIGIKILIIIKVIKLDIWAINIEHKNQIQIKIQTLKKFGN